MDGQQIVDNWTDHGPTDDSGTITLQAGQKYDVRMEFYENGGGAMARLAWEYPGQARQIVPANSLFYSADNVGGLDATYYDNQNFTGAQLSRVEPSINYDWGNGSPDSVHRLRHLQRPLDRPDRGARLRAVHLYWHRGRRRQALRGRPARRGRLERQGADGLSGTINLEAGKRYDIQYDYYENGGGAVARLAWDYPGQSRQIVPASALLFSGGTNYNASFSAGGGPISIVDSANLAVFDADDANMKSATVTLGSRPDGNAEVLTANTAGTPIVAGYDPLKGALSLSGPATKEQFAQVLRTVKYNNTAATPTAGNRTVTFVVNDGFDSSNAAVSTVSVR